MAGGVGYGLCGEQGFLYDAANRLDPGNRDAGPFTRDQGGGAPVNFLNPIGLLALLALPVIVWLHLRRDRSRQVIVSNLKMWDFLDVQLSGRRARKLPLSWILFFDLLIALLLGLALARPQLNLPGLFEPRRHVVILLDDSTSMLAADISPSRFEQAKQDVLELLGELNEGDVATVITFGRELVEVGDTRQMSLGELADGVQSLEAGGEGSALLDGLSFVDTLAEQELPMETHIFTDGVFPDPHIDDRAIWHPYGGPANNQAVMELDVVQIGGSKAQVFARITNFDETAVSRELVLFVDDKETRRETIDLPAQGSVTRVWSLVGQPERVQVGLAGEDDLPADDNAYFVLRSDTVVQVALVADDPFPLDKALNAVPGVELELFTPDEYRPGLFYDLIVFRGYLPEDWPVGHVLVVEPPEGSSLLVVTGRKPVGENVSMENVPVLDQVDLGAVRWSYAWTVANLEEFDFLAWAGETPLLVQRQADFSQITLLLPELAGGNFTRHPAFPILIANIVDAARGAAVPNTVGLGEELTVDGQTLRMQSPGFFGIEMEDPTGEKVLLAVGVNAGSELESDVNRPDWIGGITPTGVAEYSEASAPDLTPWLLGLALLFLFIEVRWAWR